MELDDDRTRTHVTLTGGTMVSHYRIVEKIGAGGMGEVYLAEDTELNRKVALKFLPPHLCADADCRARFKREAQAAAKLNHPNIVTIHEVSEFNGRPFFAMEYVEGTTIRDLGKDKDFPLSRVVELGIQVCEGLARAHTAGIVHRDIKPSNILIDRDGRAKIVDFGLASIRGSEQITKTGSTLGTVGYMSPEQARGEAVDARSDLFSLGVVLYELIAGRSPFKADSEVATVRNILEAAPEPLARYKTQVPDELQRIISKALAKDSTLRYQHADELSADLRALQRNSSLTGLPKRPRRRATLIIGGSLLFLVVAVTGYFYLRPDRHLPSEKSIAVLPFADMSPQKDQEYFCDGLTEELINRLSNVRELKVPARTSAFAFKGKSEDIKTIGEKLGVQTVLEGSVRKAGNHLRVTTQLINVADGYHIWSETFDRELQDVFAVQDEISIAIIDALHLQLTRDEIQKVTRRPMDNVAAYECYLKANHEIWRFNEGAIDRAMQYLQSAIDMAGDSPLLFAGMAMACYQSVNIGLKQEESISQAEQWAEKALALDPDCPQAHVALGWLSVWKPFPTNFTDGIRHYQMALRINPLDGDALRTLTVLRSAVGQSRQADSLLAVSRQIDPLNIWNDMIEGFLCTSAGRYDLALESFQKAYAEDSENVVLLFYLAWAYALTGRADSAVVIVDRSEKIDPKNALVRTGLMLKHGLQKDREQVLRDITPEFRRTCWRDYDWSFNVAAMLALVDARSESLDWLENAVNRGNINYPLLRQFPYFDGLRGEERFKKLMERVKYEWEHFEA